MSDLIHNKEKQKYTLVVEGQETKVEYKLKEGKMYLTYAEVPYHLRGKGVGKELVLKTFEQLTKEGYKAIAVCSYVKAIAKRSKEWNSIIG